MAFDFDFASVFADDAADDDESEAVSVWFGCFEGFKHGAEGLAGDAASVVGDGEGDLVVGELGMNGDFAV